MIKVCKFGGSSLSTKEGFDTVKDLIRRCNERKIVIVSAIGKGGKYVEKVTDLLFRCCDKRKRGVKYSGLLDEAFSRYIEIATAYGYKNEIGNSINRIYKEISNCSDDYLVSRGEYLSAVLTALIIGYDLLDAYDVVTVKDGIIDVCNSCKNFDRLSLKRGIVVPGFYGNEEGKISLLRRGGSDETGALFACVLNAVYENWTDVSGIKRVSPKITDNSPTVKRLTYSQVEKLALSGAEVFSDGASKILLNGKVKTIIRNTFQPKGKTTLISERQIKGKKIQIINYRQLDKQGTIYFIGNGLKNNKILKKINSAINNLKVKHGKIEVSNDGEMVSVEVFADAETCVLKLFREIFNLEKK